MRTDTIWSDQAQQACYRALLQAMARPATVHALDADERPAWLLVAATLLDGAVTMADPDHLLDGDDLTFLQSAARPEDEAGYIIADGSRPPRFTPTLGTLDQPHLGATVLVVVARIGNGPLTFEAEGPGIAQRHGLALLGLDPHWITLRNQWTARFPLGVDLLLADDARVTALPRTTRIHGGV